MWTFLSGSWAVSKFSTLFSDSWACYVLKLAGNLSIINVDDTILRKVEEKLTEVATELLKNWEERQTKTILQATICEVFGTIHEIVDQDPIQHEIMLRLLKKPSILYHQDKNNYKTKVLVLQDF